MRNLLRSQTPTPAQRPTNAPSLSRRQLLGAGLAGLAGTLLGACGGSDEEEPATSGSSARLSSVVIENRGSETIHFNLEVNGRSFFCSDDDVLRAVGVRRADTNDLDFALALWRFVMDNRYHHEPYSPRAWAHAPTLFFNSIGFGLCDDAASLFRALATHAGLASRVWFLNGHLVSEALIDGRWVVFDSDLEAYYLDRSGRPAGVAQLAADPTLVTSPQLSLPASPRLLKALEGLVPGLDGTRAPAYLPFIADLYATTQDNWVEPWYHEVPLLSFDAAPFTLPPQARIIMSVGDRTPVTSYNDVPAPLAATVRVELAAGWAGQLSFPLLISDASGAGVVRVDDQIMRLDSDTFRSHLAARSAPLTSLEFVRSEAGDALTLPLNEQRFRLTDLNTIATTNGPSQSLTVSRYRTGGA
jgi:hypothetical protein